MDMSDKTWSTTFVFNSWENSNSLNTNHVSKSPIHFASVVERKLEKTVTQQLQHYLQAIGIFSVCYYVYF
jgi:hypothetical protein